MSTFAGLQVKDGACPICGTCCTATDAVPLNGTPEQVSWLGNCEPLRLRGRHGCVFTSLSIQCYIYLSGLVQISTAACTRIPFRQSHGRWGNKLL